MPIEVAPYVPPDKRTLQIDAAMRGPVTCGEFHSVRNQLLSILIQFGSIGPMGKFSTQGDCEYFWDPHPDQLPVAGRKMDFYVVSDQYNDTNRFHWVESANPHVLKPGLLDAVIAMLRETNGWIIHFALVKGSLVVSASSIGHIGELFTGCDSIAELELRCRRPQ